MQLGQGGLQLLRNWEGVAGKPVLKAYLDGGGVPTIGYGHTKGVHIGMTATAAQCESWLKNDCAIAVACINECVKVHLTQNQFDALVCFAFNVGNGAFKDSTLLKKLNALDYDGVPAQLSRWNKDNGHVVDGLTNRRNAEIALWRA